MYFHVCPLNLDGFKKPTRGINEKGELADPDAVGFDIYAPAAGFLDPLSRKLIPLGFAAEFQVGWQGKYADRSGMGNKGIHVFAGTMDPSYRGEWKVVLYNSNPHVFEWEKGDRLIQVVFSEIWPGEAEIVTRLSESRRGDGAFSSTGK